LCVLFTRKYCRLMLLRLPLLSYILYGAHISEPPSGDGTMRAIIVVGGIVALSISVPWVWAQTTDLVPRPGSEKPSFDCATAKTAAARLICGDAELASLDRDLGASFQRQKLRLSSLNQLKFVDDELIWIRDRNRRCGLVGHDNLALEELASSKSCLLGIIRERIALLDDAGQPHSALPSVMQTQRDDEEAQPPVIRTSCHMDHCSWFRLKAKSTLQTRWSGDLVKVLSDQGESFHPNGSYEQPQPIQWKIAVESYVLCSKVRPAVIDRDGDRWLATFLAPGNPDANPGFALDSYIVYLFVCHDRDFSKKVVAGKDVAPFGYPAKLVDHAGEQVKVAAPADILASDQSAEVAQTKGRTPKEVADQTADQLKGCVEVNHGSEVSGEGIAKEKCRRELDGFMRACREFWLSIGHSADGCGLNAAVVIQSAVGDASPSAKSAASDKLMYCVNPEIQYGQYSSYDGGNSTIKILEGKCKREYLDFLQACEQSEDSRSCVLAATIATQLAIKQFGK
jgi:uncharacterized protein